MSRPTSTAPERLTSLDGLRGLAALVVLVHHVVLASVPLLAAVHLSGASDPLPGWAQAVVHTPLHLLWAGEEFVLVFFALSGLVLTLPAARGRELSPARYYPSRLLRLYGPVWMAIAFAAIARSAVPHEVVPGASWWLNAHAEPMSAWQVGHDGTLLFGTGGFAATSVLWSLRWEVLFSLLLPVFLWIGGRTRGMWWAVAGVAFAALAMSGSHESPRYMPAFLLGSLMAFEIDRVRALEHRLGRSAKAAIAAGCVLAMTAAWWVQPGAWLGEGLALEVADGALRAISTAGACVAVALPLVLAPFRRFLDTPAMQWVGSRSFSLYLVHEPIVVAVALALGGTAGLLPVAAIAVPVALLAAEGFFRVAERPMHRWARGLGELTESLVRAPRRSHSPGSA